MTRRANKASRGYFGVGIYHPKTHHNVGSLYRSAHSLGAAFVYTIGARYPRQASDTTRCWRHVPAFDLPDVEALRAMLHDCMLVGVELDGAALDLPAYSHPERACYLLGAEDHGLPQAVLDQCHSLVQVPGVLCHNVAMAGGMVLYDRIAKERI